MSSLSGLDDSGDDIVEEKQLSVQVLNSYALEVQEQLLMEDVLFALAVRDALCCAVVSFMKRFVIAGVVWC